MTREEAYQKYGEAAWSMPMDGAGNIMAPASNVIGASYGGGGSLRQKILQSVTGGGAGAGWGSGYWNPATEDPYTNQAIQDRIYNQVLGTMGWEDVLRGGFQSTENLTPTIYDDVIKRINATGWDDAKKKEAMLNGVNDHYNQFGSGFTEWSTPEGLAGLFGLPDYNQARHGAEDQRYSEQHKRAAEEADADSFSNFMRMAGGAAMAAGGFAGLYGGLGNAAGGAMDMGVGGVGEAMGLGDVPWGVNPAGGGVDYLSNIGDVFNYTPEFPLGDLSFPTNISVPGVDLTNIFPMTGVNAATGFASTGFPALDFGTTNSSFFDRIKEIVGKVPGSTLAKLIGGSGTSGFSALGAGLGGLLGSMNGSKQAGTTTSVEDIPDWQKALLFPAFNQASGLLNQQTNQSNPLIPPAQSQLESTIKGDYLNSNPYLDKAFNMGADQIKERLSPQFGHMQAFGDNSGWQQAYGRSLGDLATNVYGGNYQNERQRQLTASAQAPSFTSEASSASWSPFKNFMSVAGGRFGGTQSQPYFTNPFGGAMSGALLGGKLFG